MLPEGFHRHSGQRFKIWHQASFGAVPVCGCLTLLLIRAHTFSVHLSIPDASCLHRESIKAAQLTVNAPVWSPPRYRHPGLGEGVMATSRSSINLQTESSVWNPDCKAHSLVKKIYTCIRKPTVYLIPYTNRSPDTNQLNVSCNAPRLQL